jgi:hypothetical protein
MGEEKMKEGNKKIGIIVIVLLFIVGAIAYLPNTNLNFMAQSYETSNTTVTAGTETLYDGKTVLQGYGEVTPQGNYLSTWLRNGQGEKINLQGKTNYWNLYWQGYIGANINNRPASLIGRYWFTGTFTDASGSHNVIWAGGYDNTYLEIAADSPQDFNKHMFPNIAGQYKAKWGTDNQPGPTLSDGWNQWWSNPYSQTYTQYPGGLQTNAVSFYIKSGYTGTMSINIFIEYATLKEGTSTFTPNTAIIQMDSFEVKSAVGNVDVDGINSYRFVDTNAVAGGTQDVYTKYVFQEGKTVTLTLDTDEARPENSKPWKLQILKGNDVPFLGPVTIGTSSPISPDSSGYYIIPEQTDKKVTFIIPDGTFIPGGNNEWHIKLINSAVKIGAEPQAEIKIFVVDTYEHSPSGTTMAVASVGQINKALTVSFSAFRNQVTKSPIASFRIWGRWNNMVSGEYAFDTSVASITVSGEKYTGLYTYTPTRTGTLYLQVHAVDAKSYTGGEGKSIVTVTAAPLYEFAITVTDSVSNSPISGATVIFGSTSKTTTSTGYLTFDVISGVYQLIVSADGYTTKNEGTITLGSNMQRTEQLVSTTGGTTPPPENNTTTPGEYILTVTVTSSGGNVEGAAVKASGVSQLTDMYGIAAITIPSGEQTLSVSAQGYQLYTELITVAEDTPMTVELIPLEGVTSGVNITLTARVQTVDGFGVEGADVSVGSYSQKSDANGVATIVMPSITTAMTLIVSAQGYTTYTSTIYPSGNQEFTVSLTKSQGIPGFDMVLLIGALGIVVITLMYRKKKRQLPPNKFGGL